MCVCLCVWVCVNRCLDRIKGIVKRKWTLWERSPRPKYAVFLPKLMALGSEATSSAPVLRTLILPRSLQTVGMKALILCLSFLWGVGNNQEGKWKKFLEGFHEDSQKLREEFLRCLISRNIFSYPVASQTRVGKHFNFVKITALAKWWI